MAETAVVRRAPTLPADYKPEEGLKRIALAETAEKYFRRAKDSDKLFQAVEAKLGEQRKFVLWWDGTKHGGEPRRGGSASQNNSTVKLPPGVEPMTIHRWRTKLKDEKKYNDTLAAAAERCRRTVEFEKGATEQKGASGTGDNEWYTPAEYTELARSVLGEIDLDPASSAKAQKTVRAKRYFTKDTDGLQQEWCGRVWLNPPYAQPFMSEFVAKLLAELESGRTTEAILLTHNYTDTGWFHSAARVADAICFTRGRVRFIDKNGDEAAPTQGQAFFYFGPNRKGFASTFATVGFTVGTVG